MRPIRCSTLPWLLAATALTAQEPAADRTPQAAMDTLRDQDLTARADAAAVLRAALAATAEDDAPRSADDRLAMLRQQVAAAADLLPATSRAHARLATALAAAPTPMPPARAAEALRFAAADLLSDLEFVPVTQAARPTGFPDYRAVDEIELRDYPAYRMVRAELRGGGSMAAFWPLFRHIESRGIAMTTPVQMDYAPATDPAHAGAATMAFLYGDPALGKLERDEIVEVVDVAKTTVLSIGARGYDTKAIVDELAAALRAWVAAHPEWRESGPLRTMNHNSPMVPRDRRYFEVQLPVARRAAADTAR